MPRFPPSTYDVSYPLFWYQCTYIKFSQNALYCRINFIYHCIHGPSVLCPGCFTVRPLWDPTPHCDICHIKLCIPCVGVNLSDRCIEHKVVPFGERGSTTKCSKHATKVCEIHCEHCNILICSLCVSSKEHNTHDDIDILKSLTTKKEAIKGIYKN